MKLGGPESANFVEDVDVADVIESPSVLESTGPDTVKGESPAIQRLMSIS